MSSIAFDIHQDLTHCPLMPSVGHIVDCMRCKSVVALQRPMLGTSQCQSACLEQRRRSRRLPRATDATRAQEADDQAPP
eukprot:9468620-Pyramimonas_sp.AAC.1